MKIAVLGAPGSGKSDFAQKLARELGWRSCVIDHYVDKLRDETGQAYGAMGNFVDDLQVVFKRREWELSLRGKNTITVGTILDSACHNFSRTELIEHLHQVGEEQGIPMRKVVGLTQTRLQGIAATFGLLYTDLWDYDYAFLLKRPKTRVDGQYQRHVERALEELIRTYRAPVLSFNPEVTDDEKASTAAAAIRTLEEDDGRTPEADERGVRRGSEDGEADGDSSEPVPDVPEQRGTGDDA